MRNGKKPQEACDMTIKRIADKFQSKSSSQIAVIALNKDGEFGASSLNDGFSYNIASNNKIISVKVESYYKKLQMAK